METGYVPLSRRLLLDEGRDRLALAYNSFFEVLESAVEAGERRTLRWDIALTRSQVEARPFPPTGPGAGRSTGDRRWAESGTG